jgi:uncharacterized protein YlxW (UPF0749 family)
MIICVGIVSLQLAYKYAMEGSAATSKIESLESRLSALESAQGSTSSDTSLLMYQAQTLEKLKIIRDQLQTNGTDDKIREERDAAVARNKELEKEVSRLNYRVNHLVKALNAEEQKNNAGK